MLPPCFVLGLHYYSSIKSENLFSQSMNEVVIVYSALSADSMFRPSRGPFQDHESARICGPSRGPSRGPCEDHEALAFAARARTILRKVRSVAPNYPLITRIHSPLKYSANGQRKWSARWSASEFHFYFFFFCFDGSGDCFATNPVYSRRGPVGRLFSVALPR